MQDQYRFRWKYLKPITGVEEYEDKILDSNDQFKSPENSLKHGLIHASLTAYNLLLIMIPFGSIAKGLEKLAQ